MTFYERLFPVRQYVKKTSEKKRITVEKDVPKRKGEGRGRYAVSPLNLGKEKPKHI